MNLFLRKSLRLVHFFILILHRFSLRWPKSVFAISCLIIALAAYQSKNLVFQLTAEDMVEGGFPSVLHFQDLKESFNEKSSTLIFAHNPAGQWSENTLCALRTFISKENLINTEIIKSFSSFDFRKSEFSENKSLFYPRLIDLDCNRKSDTPISLSSITQNPLGKIYSLNSNDIIISFTFEDVSHFKFGSFNPQILNELKSRLKNKFPNLTFYSIGNADYMSYIVEGIESTNKLNLVFCLFLVIALRFSFGSWRTGLLYISTLIATYLVIIGAKASINSPSDALSDCLFMMIGVACLEDFIFISYLQMRYTRWRTAFRKLLLPSFLTSMTTFVGFISLVTSDIEAIKRLGSWAATAALLEWIFLCLALPAFLQVFKVKRVWVTASKARGFRWADKLNFKSLPQKWSLRFLIVYPLAAISIFYLNTNDHFFAVFDKNHPFRQSYEYLKETRQWQTNLSLIYSSHMTQTELQEQLIKLNEFPFIKKIESGLSMTDYFTENIPDNYKHLAKIEVEGSTSFERYKDKKNRQRVILYFNEIETNPFAKIKEQLENYCHSNHCFVAGAFAKHVDLATEIPRTLLDSLLSGLLILSLMIAWICWASDQGHRFLPIVLSSFWGPAAMIVLVAVTQVPLNFLTCMFASVLVGLTGDSAINFLMLEPKADRKNSMFKGVEALGGGSILCLTIMGGASLIFLFSYFAPPRDFGVLLCCGFILALFGDLWILKGLMEEKNSSTARSSPGRH